MSRSATLNARPVIMKQAFMITGRAFKVASLTVTFPKPHAMAVDKQDDVFEMRPVPPEVRDALLATVDALALHAVISLNEAHGVLVNAGAVTSPPPSDQWYRLIEQLTERQDV